VTVGAADDNGTATTRDDVIPFWSSQGPTVADALAKPDVVAPGRKIVSVRVPGSTIDQQLPTHVEGPTTIRLSGTSEATAVTAGVAALLAAGPRHLNPDQIKAVLTSSATPVSGSVNAAGAGEINAARALTTSVPAHWHQTARPSNAFVKLLADLGAANLIDALHVNWDHVNWDHVNWDQVEWDHVNWDHVNWDHVNWDHVNWDHVNWDHVNWDTVNWD
jgi:serine protease AprX